MITTVDVHDFRDAFRQMGRSDQFSHAGLAALFDYLEEMEADMREPMELDVIAFCLEYNEYASALEAAEEHGFEPSSRFPDLDESHEEHAERIQDEALEWLQDRTQVIEVDDGSVIISAF